MTSDLLYIIYTQNDKTYCEIWYRNNYYWYFKYQHIFTKTSILHCEWDINNPYILYILLSNNEFIEMNYCFDINSYINNENDNMIGVIDGCTLKLTNYDVYIYIYYYIK